MKSEVMAMKIWILAVFRLASGLCRAIEEYDKKIDRIALDPFGVTLKQYEKVIALSDKKRRLINLKVMYMLLKEKLDEHDIYLITKYARGISVAEIAERLEMKQSAVYKRLNRAIAEAEEVLAKSGYDEKRMECEYGEFRAVKSALMSLKSKAKG